MRAEQSQRIRDIRNDVALSEEVRLLLCWLELAHLRVYLLVCVRAHVKQRYFTCHSLSSP